MVASEEWINPVNGIVTSSFGSRINPVLNVEEFHNGIDIAVPLGTDVLAVKDGLVINTNVSKTFGKTLRFVTVDGYDIMYAHLDDVFVKPGDVFKQSQAIAASGNTGLSTGAHLHMSVWKDNILIDPLSFVDLDVTEGVLEEYRVRGEAFN